MAKYVKTVTARGKRYRYFWPSRAAAAEGVRPVRLPLDDAQAEAEAGRLQLVVTTRARPDFAKHARQLLKAARRRCAASGAEVTVTEDELIAMMEQQGWRCAVSGIPFDMEATGPNRRAFRRPYRPSLDRKRSGGPYSAENVRLVCVAVNVALNEWGDEVLSRIARGIVDLETLREHRLENGLEIASLRAYRRRAP